MSGESDGPSRLSCSSDDFAVAAAGGSAELPALAALLGVGIAEPAGPRGSQLLAVGPEVRPRTGVLAEFAESAVLAARRAALAHHVRLTQCVLPIAAESRCATLLHLLIALAALLAGALII